MFNPYVADRLFVLSGMYEFLLAIINNVRGKVRCAANFIFIAILNTLERKHSVDIRAGFLSSLAFLRPATHLALGTE